MRSFNQSGGAKKRQLSSVFASVNPILFQGLCLTSSFFSLVYQLHTGYVKLRSEHFFSSSGCCYSWQQTVGVRGRATTRPLHSIFYALLAQLRLFGILMRFKLQANLKNNVPFMFYYYYYFGQDILQFIGILSNKKKLVASGCNSLVCAKKVSNSF